MGGGPASSALQSSRGTAGWTFDAVTGWRPPLPPGPPPPDHPTATFTPQPHGGGHGQAMQLQLQYQQHQRSFLAAMAAAASYQYASPYQMPMPPQAQSQFGACDPMALGGSAHYGAAAPYGDSEGPFVSEQAWSPGPASSFPSHRSTSSSSTAHPLASATGIAHSPQGSIYSSGRGFAFPMSPTGDGMAVTEGGRSVGGPYYGSASGVQHAGGRNGRRGSGPAMAASTSRSSRGSQYSQASPALSAITVDNSAAPNASLRGRWPTNDIQMHAAASMGHKA